MRTPHLYSEGALCLYDRSGNEWNWSCPLVDTIIPWTVRWLFHYEYWWEFGVWLGDKHPYVPPKSEEPIWPSQTMRALVSAFGS